MIRRLFTRALSNLVGDDPHPEPFHQHDRMVEPVVVPELEPDPYSDLPAWDGWNCLHEDEKAAFAAEFRARRAGEDVIAEAERIARGAVQS